MEQFESLLTCCVCLDRYRNPKLLPCQHSFCMEPCMDGLVDYVRRQVKCPECRAEHRIPYQGVQGFPTNVTLQRFLELHAQIAGELPDPTAGQIMERCNVCSEKAYCALCAHCDKKVCDDCKSAHMEVLRREIARINNQVRRGMNRLQDILGVVERNTTNLQTNCAAVAGEVDEIHKRLAKALKDRTDFLRTEVDRYLATELRNLTHLKDNLELELSNIQSNCDLAEKHMNDDTEWEDTELMDTKEIFLKTVEFLRNFDYEAGDYNRRVRFIMTHDPNQLVMHVASYGELNITQPNAYSGGLQPSQGLTRSKSDHRLATQFRQQEESKNYYENDEPILGGRKFGERRPPPPERHTRDYNVTDDYSGYESEHRPRRFRSRFVRSHQQDNDSDTEQSIRSAKTEKQEKEKEKVVDTEDATRGPLSGIFRLSDCPRVMQRIMDAESGKKKEKKEPPPPPKPVVQPTPQPRRPPPAQRQQSEDDEITRLKRQNKGAASSQEPDRPAPRPVEEERTSIARKPPTPAREASSDGESDESVGSLQRTQQRKAPPPVQKPAATGRRPSADAPTPHRPAARAPSTESSASTESSGSAVKHTGAILTIAELKAKYCSGGPKPNPRLCSTGNERTAPVTTNGTAGGAQRVQSRFVGSQRPTPAPAPAEPAHDEDSDTSSEEETDSSEESEEEPAPQRKPESQAMARSDIGPLLARSSNARSDAHDNKSKDPPPSQTRYRSRQPSQTEEEPAPRYGAGSSYNNRYGSKPREEETTSSIDDDSKYPTARSRYLALKERRNRLARSKSSHTGFGAGDDDDQDDPVSPTTASPSAYLAARYGSGTGGSELSRSRSSHALKSRESSPERPPTGEKDGAALSSWARYLKNKYGSRGKERDTSGTSSSASRRLSLGLPLRSANELASSDDDSKNAAGSPISPTAATAAVAGFAAAGSSPRSQYLQKRRLQFSVGSRGSEPGCFTWPRGIAVGPDNTMVVADSSNHRVQVFDSNGIFIKEFGQYGSGEGEFDCLAGVAVNRIGQYIIADRYNHRIQVFDPQGRFLRAFGSQGTGDGKFNYPWGITTDALGFIYVCDKENHRVQVFQSDGTFVGKFGSFGAKLGQLEHPHYIAVSSTNRVLVSDSNNHRIQVFDVNGRVLSSFGEEGSEDGQFKFPRGVAVDDQGYIVVADSGNNRIQIFHPDGTFLRAFGSWGSGDGEFKGLEGIAVMTGGNIIVCDRENHRVQVF
ncbi:RING finger protein nhl-1 isoform X1 [Bombyx mori]|uniref:RING finger protein nhl-1 n=1 Tax=Bombyx mori TaxID=7091 RepID=A0A8R2QVL2_BOMMO|nr:RING finger protein nhl-1 isoform X1 [Bombyx mori]XP_037868327.1 RING finger protein nhl-1 isoform X1 [Bombyx mori]XP_037868328.1 RING finger protein nhl-1 isoform X1 [Bombyx mori]XP_037868329.1 RING finger protein nhl-1 isoform X1 [Bombyx mori]